MHRALFAAAAALTSPGVAPSLEVRKGAEEEHSSLPFGTAWNQNMETAALAVRRRETKRLI